MKRMKAQFFPYKDENPHSKFPIIVTLLILVNIGVFLWSLSDFEDIILSYGFIPIEFSFLTLLTSMFLHGGIDHIFGNMWYLWVFGDNVEDRLGRVKFLVFYMAAGMFAGIVHFISDPASSIPAIGASGAISGVLGAYAAIFPKVKVKTIGPLYQSYELPAWTMFAIWFGMQIVFGGISLLGGEGSGIAFFAHIGGFAFGYMLGLVYNKRLWGILSKR
jgi:membrane associated rhomboid family serine protease